jgi:hypothetical protein
MNASSGRGGEARHRVAERVRPLDRRDELPGAERLIVVIDNAAREAGQHLAAPLAVPEDAGMPGTRGGAAIQIGSTWTNGLDRPGVNPPAQR